MITNGCGLALRVRGHEGRIASPRARLGGEGAFSRERETMKKLGHGTCAHVTRRRTDLIALLLHPSSRATSDADNLLARISRTLSSLKMARWFLVPAWPCCRPLTTLSAALSAGVPRNRCAGFTQEGLSQ